VEAGLLIVILTFRAMLTETIEIIAIAIEMMLQGTVNEATAGILWIEETSRHEILDGDAAEVPIRTGTELVIENRTVDNSHSVLSNLGRLAMAFFGVLSCLQ